jgi:fermentation-respiration switch protein FrsA (DUF1100 family)
MPGRLTVRRAATAVIAVALIAYLGALGYLRFNERAYVFLPGDRAVARPAPEFALNEERLTVASTDGVTVTAWAIPSRPPGEDRPWLLICHGNFGNIGYGQRPEFYALMRDVGLNLLAFDYRGYGESSGSPDESGFYEDARATYDYLQRVRAVPPSRIVIFGHSLGSAVAIELATRVSAAGLIVDGAFTSVVDRAQELYPLFPIRLIASQRFPSIDRIRAVTIPKLFLHSPEDEVVPYAHGQRLFAAASAPKRFVDVKGGHEFAYRADREVYYGAIGDFVRSVTSTR